MLEIKDLTVDYGEEPVLNELSLSLAPQRIHGLVGRNGEGKTTLLNSIYGTVLPQAGSIEWNARPLRTEDVAYLETELYFYPMITGREYLKIFTSKNPLFDYHRWNELFELPLRDFISTYSTGMKKKLALLAIFALDRPFVMLDEPFNGLDIETNLLLSQILLAFAGSGKTILVTSHILESLTSICEEIHWLHHGHIEQSYTPANVHSLKEEILEDLNQQKLPALKQLLQDKITDEVRNVRR